MMALSPRTFHTAPPARPKPMTNLKSGFTKTAWLGPGMVGCLSGRRETSVVCVRGLKAEARPDGEFRHVAIFCVVTLTRLLIM